MTKFGARAFNRNFKCLELLLLSASFPVVPIFHPLVSIDSNTHSAWTSPEWMMNWSRMTPPPTSTMHPSRGSHIRVVCRSVCDRDQNGIKRSTLFFGADQGIKRNSEWLISTDQCTFLDTTEVWLCFVLWTPVKSSDQEPWNGAIKWSRAVSTRGGHSYTHRFNS